MRSKDSLRVFLYDASGGGGICHYTFQLAESLAKLGHSIRVLTTEDYELSNCQRSFKLHLLFKRSWFKKLIVSSVTKICDAKGTDKTSCMPIDGADSRELKHSFLVRILKTVRLRILNLKVVLLILFHRPHLVHFQLINRDEDYFFIKLLQRLRFTTVYTAHDLLPHNSDAADDRQVFTEIYKSVNGIIVHSNRDKQEMINSFNIEEPNIFVVPHGANDLFYRSKQVSREQARVFLEIPQNSKVILFFGHIKRYKGLEYLIEAFSEIKRRVSSALLLIAGRIDDPYYTSILAYLTESKDIRCINEYIPLESVGNYFTASDLVVLPYIKTYQSGVLLSAYAAGRPVVVSDTGGLGEIVEASNTGLVVPPKDVDALIEAITKIITDPDLAEKMSRFAKELAETTYSWSATALKTIDVYRSLLNDSTLGEAEETPELSLNVTHGTQPATRTNDSTTGAQKLGPLLI